LGTPPALFPPVPKFLGLGRRDVSSAAALAGLMESDG